MVHRHPKGGQEVKYVTQSESASAPQLHKSHSARQPRSSRHKGLCRLSKAFWSDAEPTLLTRPRPRCGSVLAHIWLCSGPHLALSWLTSGSVLAHIWLCSGPHLALFWPTSVPHLSLFWPTSGSHLAHIRLTSGSRLALRLGPEFPELRGQGEWVCFCLGEG